jgi:hypothetical protein
MPMLELEVASMLVLALVLTRRGVVERWGLMSSLQAVAPRTLGLLWPQCQHGRGTELERAGQVHRRRQVLRRTQLDVHPDVIR